jgi:penicillin-binding protein 1A
MTLNDSEKVPQRRNRGCGFIFFFLMLVVGSLFGAGLGVFVWILEDAKTTIATLEEFRPKVGSKVYSSDGELLGEFSVEQRQAIPLGEIPLHVQKAFVATEDDKFYVHKGVRPDAIANAALYTLRTRRTRGGSTITQQISRNVESLNVGQARTLWRKAREAIVALQIEREFSKDEILELYLNQIFLGISARGVEAASRQYYDKHCADLTLGEAATLAGLTRAPNAQEPIHNPENALTRRDIVLGQMLDNGFISQEEYDTALLEDLDASVVTPEEREQRAAEGKGLWAPNKFDAPYFVEEIREFILNEYGMKEVFQEGLEIHTTLDMRMQRAAEKALLTALDTFDEKKLAYLKKRNKEDEFVPVSGGLLCIDNRAGYKGYVRAMVGGRDFATQKYNTVTQAMRQPGSSVKPFVWAAAIASGMSPSTVIIDEPFERLDALGRAWRPKNFGGTFNGPMPIRHALEKSVNIVAVKLVEQVGPTLIASYLRKCGISTPIDPASGLTIALGTPTVRLIDHAVAYSCFPNGGVRYDPQLITTIRNRDGMILYKGEDFSRNEQVLDPKVAYVVTHMLEGVCEPDFTFRSERYPTGFYPTGWATHTIERPRGGKTGTTNSSRDAWFAGFTADFTCLVWVGYRDNRVLGSGRNYTGGRLACPIWTEFMTAAHEGLPPREFDEPRTGIDFFDIDRLTGVLGGDYEEAYIEGTVPPTEWVDYDPTATDLMDEQLLETLDPVF